MPSVTCPSCGEKGRVPAQFVGIRIKCKKCGNAFLVAPPAKSGAEAEPSAGKAASAASRAMEGAPAKPRYEGIEVEGLDESSWTTAEVAHDEHDSDHDHPHEEAVSSFSAHEPSAGGMKQYKVLSPRDAFFAGKFDLELLEKAVNHYARQGWVVKGIATPHVVVFGAEREQIVILMER